MTELKPILELEQNPGNHVISAAIFTEYDAESVKLAKAVERAVKKFYRHRKPRGGRKPGYSITAFHRPPEVKP